MYDKLTYKFDYQIEKSPLYPMDYRYRKRISPILAYNTFFQMIGVNTGYKPIFKTIQ